MASSNATTVKGYLDELPADRRKVVSKVRNIVRRNLPKGYEEKMNWGMICYQVPLKVVPETYNGQPLCYAALAAQKNYHALYLMNVYGDKKTSAWFKEEFKKAGKKLDMGKSCVRFRSLDDLPLDTIAEVIAKTPMKKYIEMHNSARKKR